MAVRPRADGHWADLDGLRAFAILAVLARHSLRPFVSEDTYQSVAAIGPVDVTPFLLNGWVGVDLFFVLSGFLIGRQAWRASTGWGRFWFKRAARILPAYWTCLGVVALGLTATDAWPRAWPDFLAHVVMLQDYTGSVFVPAFWSLGAEEKFYLLAPALAALALRAARRSWQVAALAALWLVPVVARAVVSTCVSLPVSYEAYFSIFRSPFHLTYESLVIGFTIAWLTMRPGGLAVGRIAREALFWGGTAIVAAFVVPAPILVGIDTMTIVLVPALLGLGFGGMVLAAVSGTGSYSLCLGWRGWGPVAILSYTLYLTHMMVLPLSSRLASAYPLMAPTSITREWIALLPWYVLLSTLSAFVLHRFVEAPALAWRNRRLTTGAGSGPSSRPAPAALGL